MYGSVLMGYEAGHLCHSHASIFVGETGLPPALTDIGRLQLEATHWCQAHPDRGEQHTPVALLWDFHTGWEAPRHLYTSDTYLVWGNMPYEKGDHQIDQVLRALYPRYEDAGFYHNEQGFLTITPCGDSFDVLLSDVSADVLQRYPCVVILGETRLEGVLLEKLTAYVAGGGNLIAWASQLGPEAERLFGVVGGECAIANHAILPDHPWPVNETPFPYRKVALAEGAEAIVSTRQGAPLVVRKGACLLFTSEYGLCNVPLKPSQIPNEVDAPLASPYALLEHVRAILLPMLRSFNLVTVEGPPLQYFVNVTAQPDCLFVTLCNNSPEVLQGTIKPKRAAIRSGSNLMTGEPLSPGEEVWLKVLPLEVAVIEMLLDRPVLAPEGLA